MPPPFLFRTLSLFFIFPHGAKERQPFLFLFFPQLPSFSPPPSPSDTDADALTQKVRPRKSSPLPLPSYFPFLLSSPAAATQQERPRQTVSTTLSPPSFFPPCAPFSLFPRKFQKRLREEARHSLSPPPPPVRLFPSPSSLSVPNGSNG